MGVMSGSMTFKAYAVEGYDYGVADYETLLNKLNKGIFKPLNKEKGEKESFGFADSKDIFSNEIHFNTTFYDNYVYFNFRRDTLKLQKAVINHYIKELEKNFTKKITKKDLKEIRARAEYKYIKEVFPTVASYEAVWNLESKILYFFNTSSSVNEKFMEWFERNIEVELIPLETSTYASMILTNEEMKEFEKKSPSSLVSI